MMVYHLPYSSFLTGDLLTTWLYYLTKSNTGVYPKAWLLGNIKPIRKKRRQNQPQQVVHKYLKWQDFYMGWRARASVWGSAWIQKTELQMPQSFKTQQFSHARADINIYTRFVEFSKAFDTVNRKLLCGKLTSYSLSSTVLNILQSMYDQGSSRVTLNSETSDEFLYRE